MGRKTWDSIPESKRPLKGRINVILSRQENPGIETSDTVLVFKDFETALMSLSENANVNELFVIGGSSLYEMAMNEYKDFCKLIIATRINKTFECDTVIPNLEKSEDFTPLHVSQTYSQGDLTFDYCFFGNHNVLAEKPELVPTKLMERYPKHQEMQYLEVIDEVINTGKFKNDRTGTGIYTKFGYQMKYDLS
jgi:dihydrofolate reductase/thymidylate synthase